MAWISKKCLERLRKEYIELMNRNELDEKRLDEIEETVGESVCMDWMADYEVSQGIN